jgi:flagellar hook-length control protein FliK
MVAGIHGQLLPSGGTMQIHLTPATLGEVRISIQVQNGMVSASFQTSNEQATKLISHTLGDLKGVLEAAGVSVERLQVTQTPRQPTSQQQNGEQNGGQSSGERQPFLQNGQSGDQQRREMLRRMWQRLSGGDPLDMVA